MGELGSSLELSAETVELAAGGIEGALILFRAVVNERPAVFVDDIA